MSVDVVSDRSVPSTHFGMMALFSATLGAGAVLMFLLEPMAAKMVLPSLGGAPAVWNTCVVFFQGMLLAGYVYAHAAPRWMGLRRHAGLHAALLVASTFTLLTPFQIGDVADGASPIASLLLTLLKSIGLPFFLLATSAPLLQAWFSTTRHKNAGDPYFLYAASNFGSLTGLLMYPLLVEPFLRLRVQARYWTYGYIAYVVLVTVCSVLLLRTRHTPVQTDDDDMSVDERRMRPSLAQRLRWIALSFAPSSLMLAVTTFISTDVAAVPLFWVGPLALYLLTFVLAFSSPPRYSRQKVDAWLPLLMLPLVVLLAFRITTPLLLVVPVHLLVFFVAALSCHSHLANERPDPAHLTEFYLLVAVGGVLGSMFNTLAAPVLFTRIIEYPTVLLLVCFLRGVPETRNRLPRSWQVGAPVVIVLATMGLMLASSRAYSTPVLFILLGVSTFSCLTLTKTRLPFAAAVAGMLVASTFRADPLGRLLEARRTFFGTYRVHLNSTGEYRTLTHGTTLHGVQSISEARRLIPIGYYHQAGPLGDVFKLPAIFRAKQIAVIGLGVGGLAAYRQSWQTWTFLEIDPAVELIARNPSLFSYLTDCSSACRVVIGDARRSLVGMPARYDVIVLDAFSSDAIPVHLVTSEALDLYLSRLTDGGVLVFHISNRHLNLEPVLARIASELGLVAMVRRDRAGTGDDREKTSSDWMVMARSAGDLGGLSPEQSWRKAQHPTSEDLWTDDFSNILTLLVRRR